MLSCEYTPEDHPIVGKWELIAQGVSEDDMNAVASNGDYVEYLQNGRIQYYKNDTIENSPGRTVIYNINAESLSHSFYYEGKVFDKELNMLVYRYKFSADNNELVLEYINGGMSTDIGGPKIWFGDYTRKK
ncbi:MAG: hypothetical protein LBT48_08310 [Prevotellaceae bacterium]|nr:hypothetical protein [Prevotellaceae bacterium]